MRRQTKPAVSQRHCALAFAIALALPALLLQCGHPAEPVQAADQTAQQFEDPAPPRIRKIELVEPPTPRAHPGVTFHRKPRPLPAGATTHDWKSFLGPAHNEISTETKLAKSWPKSGPPLVWELEKGTGYASPAIADERLVYLYRVGDEEIVEWTFGFHSITRPDPGKLESSWAAHRWVDFSDAYPRLGLDSDRAAIMRLHAYIGAA